MELKIDNQQLNTEIASFLGTKKEVIQEYYSLIKASFGQNYSKASDGFIEVPKFPNISFDEVETKDYWDKATLIGIDLPLYFESSVKDSNSIVVVGIDPLRKRKDFPLFNTASTIIGTPYALHSSYYRDKKGRTKIYLDFIQHLISNRNHVYVTDIFKIWMNDYRTGEKKNYNLKNESLRAKSLIKQEINIIKPKTIIAFGDIAEKYCKMIIDPKDSIQIVKLPHPSGANRAWNLLIEGKGTFDNKINYLIKAINPYL